MKNHLLLASLACLLPYLLGAQSPALNATYSDGHFGLIDGVAPAPHGEWIFTGYKNGLAFVGGHFGEQLHFERVFFFEEDIISGSVLNTSNIARDTARNGYYWAVSASYCDYGVSNQLFFFSEEAPTLPLAYDLGAGFATKHQLALTAEGGVLIASGGPYASYDLSYWFQDQVYSLHQFDLPYWAQLRKLQYWYEDYCLLLSDQRLELGQFAATDQGFSSVAALEINQNGYDIMRLSDSTLLLLTSQELLVLGTSLDTLQRWPNRTDAYKVAQDDSAVYLLSPDSLRILDYQLEELVVHPLNELRNYDVLDMAAQDGQVACVGTFRIPAGYYDGYSLAKPPSKLFVKTFSISGADKTPTTDVALSNVTATRVNKVDSPYDQGCATATAEGLRVTVTNEGSSHLEGITLAASKDGCTLDFPICPLYYHYELGTHHVDLAPGASTQITIGDLSLGLLDTDDVGRLCVWGFAEDGTLEVNTANNRSCAAALVVGSETVLDQETWKIWPNPTTEQLSLELPAGISPTEVVAIYNASGQLVWQTPVDSQLDVSALPHGMYTVLLLESRLTKTFVKE